MTDTEMKSNGLTVASSLEIDKDELRGLIEYIISTRLGRLIVHAWCQKHGYKLTRVTQIPASDE